MTAANREALIVILNATRPRLATIGGLGNAHAHHAGVQIVDRLRQRINPNAHVTIRYLDENRLQEAVAVARDIGLDADTVVDPTYPVLDGFTVSCPTAGWICYDDGIPDDAKDRLAVCIARQ